MTFLTNTNTESPAVAASFQEKYMNNQGAKCHLLPKSPKIQTMKLVHIVLFEFKPSTESKVIHDVCFFFFVMFLDYLPPSRCASAKHHIIQKLCGHFRRAL